MATHSSTLAWKIPWTEGPGPWGRQGSDTTERLHFHALEKEMATHSSVLAWRIPGTEKPGGLPSMGTHRVGRDWSDVTAAAAAAAVWSSLDKDKACGVSVRFCEMWTGNFLNSSETTEWGRTRMKMLCALRNICFFLFIKIIINSQYTLVKKLKGKKTNIF